VPQLYYLDSDVMCASTVGFYVGELRAQTGILLSMSKTVVLKLRPALNCACPVSRSENFLMGRVERARSIALIKFVFGRHRRPLEFMALVSALNNCD
jgi:hypothetical protein